jgi:hydroxyacylglutathione hydrolase
MRVSLIPILSDNYAYLVIDDASGCAAVVDPAEPGPVLTAIRSAGVTLTHLLTTHHHWDHTAGNEAVLAEWPQIDVVGPGAEADRIPGITTSVGHGDRFSLGNVEVQVLETPCHTSGHVSYLARDALFCGDTLFVGGCGRFFEGTSQQMHHSLNSVFADISGNTKVYCGHEYTIGNLEFACSVEPENEAVKAKLEWARIRRSAGEPTVPSTLEEERSYNPFMRVHCAAVQEYTGLTEAVEIMAALREAKNKFRAS